MKSQFVALSFVATVVFIARLSAAEPVTTLADVDFWVGQGQSTSALVIDWNNGRDPLAWGYRYDGPATAEDMFRAVVAADDRLYSKIGVTGSFGTPVFGIGLDRNENSVFGISDGTIFDSDGLAVVADSMADGAAASEAGDDYAEGWLTAGFWGHYTADDSPYDGDAWASGLGVSSRVLTDGSWDGLSFAPDFVFTEPSQPFTAGAAAVVPEPSSLLCALLCAIAAAAGLRLARRRRPSGKAM